MGSADYETAAWAFYRYKPSLAGAIIFILLFLGSTVVHTYQLYKTRSLFFIPFLIGGFFEWIGYIGRAASSSQTPNWTLGPYIVQSLLLLLAPALFAASIYMLLGRIILVLQAEKHSLIKKRWLTKTFVLGDVLSFLLQSNGGGVQAAGSLEMMNLGSKIVVAGLFVQILFFGFFITTTVVFDYRLRKNPVPRCFSTEIPWRQQLNVLYGASSLILVRSIFRVIEYLEGNNGSIMKHEAYLYIFDAVLMFATMVLYNIYHPCDIAKLLRGNYK